MRQIPALTRRLAQTSSFKMSIFAAITGFLVYSSMYAFRKPFAVATFSGEEFFGFDYKVWLILAQTLGYMASKFFGIKMISELSNSGRAWLIVGLISVSWLALLGFAVLPAPVGLICFLINGFPLGLIWGIVFHYMEGRKFTEMMGSMLAASFVFSSGFVKSIGQYLLVNFSISEYWMPFATGAIFFPLLICSVFLLNHIPEPNEEDKLLRSPRSSMSGKSRMDFFKAFKPGLIFLILVYMMLTGLRDLRDNFVVEIWRGLNIPVEPELLTQTEIPITLALLVMMSLLVLVKNNKKAFYLNHWIIVVGFAVSILSTLGLQSGLIPPFLWMVLAGTGVYMAYIPFNCLLFDRLIATFKYAGNVGFLMYLVDSFGYLGSSMVLLAKQFGQFENLSWLNFYINSLLLFLSLSLILMLGSYLYFLKKSKINKESYSFSQTSLTSNEFTT
jgi:MFS family permease